MNWKTLLAYITGTVDQELLVRNEYLVTGNRILRNQIQGRLRLSTGECKALAEIGQKLGKKVLEEVATIVKPDTILAWHRKLVAQKFDSLQQRKAPGRLKVDAEIEALVVRLAQENCSWGYDRIVGALAHLGYAVSDQTVGNILKRHGLAPAPERKKATTWNEFIHAHMDILVATDFFTTEVWAWCGLVIYYIMHHVVPKQHGGTDDLANLRLVHHTCHRQIHSTSANPATTSGVCAMLGERGWWIPPRGITRREAPVTMPVLAIGGEQSFGANQAVVMRNAAAQVTEVVIPQAGHWLMEEPPAATMAAIRTFLDAKK